jgi:hypothetical protein
MSELGEAFQARCRTPASRAALKVYEKHRRAEGWEHSFLIYLRDWAEAKATDEPGIRFARLVEAVSREARLAPRPRPIAAARAATAAMAG